MVIVALSLLPVVWIVAVASARRPQVPHRSLQALLVLLPALGILNRLRPTFPLQAYGDAGQLNDIIQVGVPYMRWFLGSALLIKAHTLQAWASASLSLPEMNTYAFYQIAGAIVMSLASVILLEKNRGRLAVILPLLSPVWLLFSTAYDEYYPFVAWAVIALLLVASTPGLKKRNPVAIGAFAALLGLLYVVYMPLALVLSMAYWLTTSQPKAFTAMGTTAASCVVAVLVFWPFGFDQLIPQFRDRLLLGEIGLKWDPYVGHILSGTPFFNLSYAVSPEHLTELLELLALGAGLAPLLVFGLISFAVTGRDRALEIRSPELLSLLALLGAIALYLLFMVPKLGPVRDVDLFFPAYLATAFAAGFYADTRLEGIAKKDRESFVATATALALGAGIVPLAFLLLR